MRDFSKNTDVDENTLSVRDNSSFTPEELKRNKTIKRGPMLNMVLRYMPYLQQYEDGVLSNSVNGCKAIESTYFSIISCLYLCLPISVLCFWCLFFDINKDFYLSWFVTLCFTIALPISQVEPSHGHSQIFIKIVWAVSKFIAAKLHEIIFKRMKDRKQRFAKTKRFTTFFCSSYPLLVSKKW